MYTIKTLKQLILNSWKKNHLKSKKKLQTVDMKKKINNRKKNFNGKHIQSSQRQTAYYVRFLFFFFQFLKASFL